MSSTGVALPEVVFDVLTGHAIRDFGAEPFAPAVGAGLGAALVDAGLTDPAAPIASAPVLLAIAGSMGRAEVAAGYLVALGQGHQARRTESVLPDERARRLRILFDNSAAAIAIGDTEGRILEANRSLADMIGVAPEALDGISVYDFAHPDDHDHIRTLLYEQLIPAGKGTVSLKQRLVRADGSIGWMNIGITLAKGTADGDPDYLVAVGADVTDQYRHQAELHHQARHDPLTGLPNRRHLMETINRYSATADDGALVGLCFLDLNRFKQINDRFGHTVGDRVLTAIAARLHADTREHGDHLIARIGGDEFVALIAPPTTAERVAAVSRRLAAVFRDPVLADGRRLPVTASIGTITARIARNGAESLLAAADSGLYYAKRNRSSEPVPAPPRDPEATAETVYRRTPHHRLVDTDPGFEPAHGITRPPR
ncbi:sensor domain-containing diguanylate cyclase [Nocardia sp. NPDC050697]|uniref:sensor domain-containing diguanylate cyclase n=1 Tax=Nocardia sp. NPDC050697 TaxID=3155158 RepID=UPI0033CD66B5